MRGPIHRFLKGRSRIRLTGSGVIRCLNLLLGKGVALKDVYRENGTILAWMSTKDVELAEIYAKKSGCTVEILREKGFPAWKKQYGNRYGFVIGLFGTALSGASIFRGMKLFPTWRCARGLQNMV